MADWYREDLAFIHDVGHGDFALEAAPGILEILHRNKIWEGLVVDLGCGELRQAGFRVRTMRGYGRYRLPRAHAAFVARKPA